MCYKVNQPVVTAGYGQNPEVVLLHNVPFVKQNGTTVVFDKASKDVKTAFYALYCKDVAQTPVMLTSFSQMKVEPKEMFVQWLICNFGGENSQPDYNVETGSFNREYWDCGNKHDCPGFGNVCRKDLTPRQYSILQLFKKGYPDKMIADGLKISENTIREHRRRLFRRLNANNKQEAILNAEFQSIII